MTWIAPAPVVWAPLFCFNEAPEAMVNVLPDATLISALFDQAPLWSVVDSLRVIVPAFEMAPSRRRPPAPPLPGSVRRMAPLALVSVLPPVKFNHSWLFPEPSSVSSIVPLFVRFALTSMRECPPLR